MTHKGTAIGITVVNTLLVLTVGICSLLPEYKENHMDHPEVKYLLIIAGVLLGGQWWWIGRKEK